jgi:hypothetical protein
METVRSFTLYLTNLKYNFRLSNVLPNIIKMVMVMMIIIITITTMKYKTGQKYKKNANYPWIP